LHRSFAFALPLLFALLPGPAGAADVPEAPSSSAAAPGLRVEVFAMGQADSMLIVGPSRSVLVDCGAPIDGPKDGYKHVAAEIQRLVGQPHVDALLITHFHSDHTGEAKDAEHAASGVWGLFASGVTVSAILDHGDRYPSYGEESHPHKQWIEALPRWKSEGRYGERRVPAVGEKYDLGGGAALRFVAVNGNGVLERAAKEGRFKDGAAPSENDYSIAFVLSLGNFEMYSGGDLGGEDTRAHTGGRGGHAKRHDVYDDVETAIRAAVGNIEVLRVDHHGSPHSTNASFVQTLRPEVSIVSCGGGNSFHHPSPDVVARLQAWGPVFATSGLAKEWHGKPDAPKVEGDITITVSGDGASYAITGRDGEIFRGRSFSDEEEAQGLDHPERQAAH
jgi:hypothetical protein